MPVIETKKEYLTHEENIQYRFPQSKKKRIRNKWKKRPCNFKKEKKEYAYIINGTLVGSADALKRIISLPSLNF